MTTFKRIVGAAWTTPIGRTAIQAGLAVVVAAGTGFVDVSLWKAAALAAGAAALAKAQELSR